MIQLIFDISNYLTDHYLLFFHWQSYSVLFSFLIYPYCNKLLTAFSEQPSSLITLHILNHSSSLIPLQIHFSPTFSFPHLNKSPFSHTAPPTHHNPSTFQATNKHQTNSKYNYYM